MQTQRTRIFIDAMPLAAERISGIGHITYGVARGLLDDPDIIKHYQVTLVAAAGKMQYVRNWKLDGATYLAVPLPGRVWNRLPGLPLLPPLDLFLGRGVYIFPNFRAWPLWRSKSVTFIHDLVFLLHPDVVAPRNRRFLVGGIKRWIKRSTIVATASHSSLQEIHDHLGVPTDRLRLIRWGVDPTIFYPRPAAEITALQKHYDLPAGYILYLGNIEPRKNLVRLIEAYRRLPAALKHDHPLVLAGGGGWLAGDIEAAIAAAQAAGDVVIRPQAYISEADLPALYSGASLLAWPTLYEGYGMPPLQAMACGTPCLLSDSSSLPEIGGEAALYANSQSVSDISDKMRLLLEDKKLRDRLIALGLTNAHSFSWRQTIQQLRAITEELTA